jgi:hypothetical protein
VLAFRRKSRFLTSGSLLSPLTHSLEHFLQL